MELKENNAEFVTGEKIFTATFSAQRYITKIDKLHATRPEDFVHYYKNADGSVCCTLPLSWFKISPPRRVSEEQRQAASERLRGKKIGKSVS